MILTVLFNGYNNDDGVNRVIGTVTHNLNGKKFKVKLLNHSLNFSVAPTDNVFLRIDSNDMKPLGPTYGTSSTFFIPSRVTTYVVASSDYSFECLFQGNILKLELVAFTQQPGSITPIPGATFENGMITFKLDEIN